MIVSRFHVEGGQGVLVGGVHDEHRKKAWRFSFARVLGKDMMGTRIFLPRLARTIDVAGSPSTWLRIAPEIT
jgi:hypothetical protein